MLNSRKQISRFAQQKIFILTLVLSEKKILNETKNHNPPPFKLNGRSLIHVYVFPLYCFCNRFFFLLLSTKSLCLISPIFVCLFIHLYVNCNISLYGCCHVYNLL